MFAVSECRGVYDMPAPNGTADYTPHLLAALATRTAANEPRDLYFPPGEYHFYGPLPTEDYAEFFDSFKLFAAPTAATRQHRVEGNSHPMRRNVQFKIHLDNESDVWMAIDRDYRLGPIAITGGIALTLVDKGSILSFGDPNESNPSFVSIRGLKLECDLDREKHYGSLDTGDGRKWLIDAGAHGYVLNRTNQSFGLRMSHCYDVQLDVNTRGLKYGVISIRCDRPRGDVIGLSNGRTLLETEMDAVAPSQWTNVWEENPLIGSLISGHVADFRGETNAGNYATAPGAYPLPSTVDWTIGVGGSAINFTSWDGSYDARDYFEPWTVIKVDPVTADEPDRYLLVTSVSANSVGFWDWESKSYVSRAIGGTGAGITRYFGIPLTGMGSRFDAAARSTGQNSITGLPVCAIVPGRTPIRLSGNSNSQGPDANDPYLPIIVASCVGAAELVFGGVDMIGSADTPSHPLVNPGGIGPRYERRTREAIYDLATKSLIAMPGRGVSAINDVARLLTFHPKTDPIFGSVYAYRPADSTVVGWEIRDPRLQKNKAPTLTVRVYNPGGSSVNVSAWGGSGTVRTVSAAPGWSDVSFTLGNALQIADMGGDPEGAVIALLGTGYFVTRAWISQP
ncbi:hypothetical protein [Lacipirellula sp.]|uniref:hypothetical protein n=1 Tax=Lacipirellula sp. TaxID=2691419 RepID=UPI003D11974B